MAHKSLSRCVDAKWHATHDRSRDSVHGQATSDDVRLFVRAVEPHMDLGNPWALLSGVLIGLVGMTLFVRGKREGQVSSLLGGAALCIYPYFVDNLALMWGLFAACVAGIWWLRRFD